MSRPSPAMAALLDRLAAEDAGLGDPTLLTPDAGRAQAELSNLRWMGDMPDMAEARTVMHAGRPARWLVPENDAGRDAILHIHGGGWAFCSALTHEGASRRLAVACAAPVLTIDYRLAPEHPFPAGLDDVAAAFDACGPSRRWSVAGDSAGANLALAMMLARAEAGLSLPAQGLLFYGVYGADFGTPSYSEFADGPGLTRSKMQRYWDWYAPADQRHDYRTTPLAAPDALLAQMPPLYLNAAGIDPLKSDSDLMADRLKALGRDDIYDCVPGVVHGFMQMGPALEEARNAFARAGDVFRRRAVTPAT